MEIIVSKAMLLLLIVQAATDLFLTVLFSTFLVQPEFVVLVMMAIDGKITNVKATIVKLLTVINVRLVTSNLQEAMYVQHVIVLTDMSPMDLLVYLETWLSLIVQAHHLLFQAVKYSTLSVQPEHAKLAHLVTDWKAINAKTIIAVYQTVVHVKQDIWNQLVDHIVLLVTVKMGMSLTDKIVF